MKKLLFVAVLLIASIGNQVCASSAYTTPYALQQYQKFQDSLVAFIQAAQTINTMHFYHEGSGRHGNKKRLQSFGVIGISDVSKLIYFFKKLANHNLNMLLSDFISSNNSPVPNIPWLPSNAILYYSGFYDNSIFDPRDSGYYITKENALAFLASKPLSDLINAAYNINIVRLQYLIDILEGLNYTGRYTTLSYYMQQISGTYMNPETKTNYPSATESLPNLSLKFGILPPIQRTSHDPHRGIL